MTQSCPNCNRVFNPDQCSPRCPHIPYSMIAETANPDLAAIDALPRPNPTDRSITLSQGEILACGVVIDNMIQWINAGSIDFPNMLDYLPNLESAVAKLAANMDTGGIV